MWRSSRNYQEPDPVEFGGSKTTPARHKMERYEWERNIRHCSNPFEGCWRPCQLRQGRQLHAQWSHQVSIRRREDTIFPYTCGRIRIDWFRGWNERRRDRPHPWWRQVSRLSCRIPSWGWPWRPGSHRFFFPSWKYFWDCCALRNFRIRLARHSGVPDGKNGSGTTEELPRPHPDRACPRQGLSSEGNTVNSPTRNRERDGRDTKIPGRHWTWRGNEKNVYGTINPYLSVLVVWEKFSLLHRVITHFHIIEFIVFK